MCNLYTSKLSRDEVRALFRHYELHDQQWSDVFEQEMTGLNSDGRVFPKYAAPAVILETGKQILDHPKWGMPGPVMPSEKSTRPKFITNVRNASSRHWTPWLAGSEVVVGKDGNTGGRCLVPAAAFSEPDENTSNPRIFRWFKRTDGLPFFFAGVWREWTGDHGTIKAPNVAKHRLYAFLTTSSAPDVQPYHSQATPLILWTAADVQRWLHGTMMEALELQKPAEAGSLIVLPEKQAA